MRRFFTLLSIVLYTAAVFLAGMLVANLYALYVLVFTGAVFMIGIYIGEKLEEKFALELESVSKKAPERAHVSESEEMVVKQG